MLSGKSTVEFFLLVVVALLVCPGCRPSKSGVEVQRYDQDLRIRANMTSHPQFSTRVVGGVYVDSFVRATDQGRYSGSPPFSYNVGFYSLVQEQKEFDLISAEMKVGQGTWVDIRNQFWVMTS